MSSVKRRKSESRDATYAVRILSFVRRRSTGSLFSVLSPSETRKAIDQNRVRPVKKTKSHLDEIRNAAFIIDTSHIEPCSSPLPSQSTDQTHDCRFARQTDLVNSYEPLNCEDEETLSIKDIACL